MANHLCWLLQWTPCSRSFCMQLFLSPFLLFFSMVSWVYSASGLFWSPRHCSPTVIVILELILTHNVFDKLRSTFSFWYPLWGFPCRPSPVLLCCDSVLPVYLRYSSRKSVLEDIDLILVTLVHRSCLASIHLDWFKVAKHSFLMPHQQFSLKPLILGSPKMTVNKLTTQTSFLIVKLTYVPLPWQHD